MAGYSGTPLVKKLGLKEGASALIRGAPMDYAKLLGGLPKGVKVARAPGRDHDFIHCFATGQSELRKLFPKLKSALAVDGALWVSWPKGTSKLETDLNDNRVREIGLGCGLVDVKVCAVDDDWSGLKFVYRIKDRLKDR